MIAVVPKPARPVVRWDLALVVDQKAVVPKVIAAVLRDVVQKGEAPMQVRSAVRWDLALVVDQKAVVPRVIAAVLKAAVPEQAVLVVRVQVAVQRVAVPRVVDLKQADLVADLVALVPVGVLKAIGEVRKVVVLKQVALDVVRWDPVQVVVLKDVAPKDEAPAVIVGPVATTTSPSNRS